MPLHTAPNAVPASRRYTTSTADQPQYLQASHHLADIDPLRERFEEPRRPTDLSSTQSPNVYVDEQEGSDVAGIGTRQAPFHSVKRAIKSRPEATVYYKKRFLCHLNEFQPADIPASAIPVKVGGFVTSYWFILETSRQRAIEAEIEKEMHPPSYGSVMGDKRRRKLAKFNLKGLRKVWTK